eukprot:6861665-Lingulodinium_polyedra.AAC.1
MDCAFPPKAWFAKVAKDMKKFGGVQQPLDQTVCVFYARGLESKHDAKVAPVVSVGSGTARCLIGALDVYVDDFLFVESQDFGWEDLMNKIKGLYQRGKHDHYDFTVCGVRYHQGHDWSVTMDHREYVETLAPHDIQPDHELKQAKGTDPVTSQRWFERFRGAHGALQRLCSNARPDLPADAQISIGTSGIGITRASNVGVQKIIRKGHARIDVELKFAHILAERVRFVPIHDAG